MKYNIRTSLLLASLFLGTAWTAPAQVLSLDSVLALVDRNNPVLQEYDKKAKALDAYSDGARSWMAPMVGVGPFMTPYPNETTMGESEKGAWMFTLEQEIPNPSKLRATRSYLASRAAVEQEGRAAQFNTLRAEAKLLYYDWLIAEEKLEILKENEKIMELMLKLAHIRYPYNQGTLGNIYKAEGRLGEVRNKLIMTRSDIESNSYRLKTLMTVPLSDSIMVDTSTQVVFQPDPIIYDTTALGEHRSDVRQIDKTIQAMRLNQRLQTFMAKPDFKIRFDHMQPIGNNMPRQFSAMAMVSIPIAPWSSKMYRAEVKGMEYDIEAMKKGREALLTETQGRLTGLSSQIAHLKEQIDNYTVKIIPALRKNYQTVMLAYEENREALPMVIDAWEAMNTAQADYLEKKSAYYTMIVNYEQELEK